MCVNDESFSQSVAVLRMMVEGGRLVACGEDGSVGAVVERGGVSERGNVVLGSRLGALGRGRSHTCIHVGK